jgi:hypothetical protein
VATIPSLVEFLIKNTELTSGDISVEDLTAYEKSWEVFREMWICSGEPWVDKDGPLEKLLEKVTGDNPPKNVVEAMADMCEHFVDLENFIFTELLNEDSLVRQEADAYYCSTPTPTPTCISKFVEDEIPLYIIDTSDS